MTSVLFLSMALSGSVDADARAALALATPVPAVTRALCPCGPACPCGVACDCLAPRKLPPIRKALTTPVTTQSSYPQHMAPLSAFRPMMPAPMYFGGFGGGMSFGNCVGGA